jgi:hypothetical protein
MNAPLACLFSMLIDSDSIMNRAPRSIVRKKTGFFVSRAMLYQTRQFFSFPEIFFYAIVGMVVNKGRTLQCGLIIALIR